MSFKGRPILGAISGFFLGFWLVIVLISFGVQDSGTILALVLPLLGVGLGLAVAYWAPFGGGEPTVPATAGDST